MSTTQSFTCDDVKLNQQAGTITAAEDSSTSDNTLKDLCESHNQLLNSAVSETDLLQYASKSELSTYATKSELPTYATKSDLSTYAKKSELPDLTPYATKSELPDLTQYATKSELSTYATKSELNREITTENDVIKLIMETYPHFKISDHEDIENDIMCGTKCYEDDSSHKSSKFIPDTKECYCFYAGIGNIFPLTDPI